MVCDGPREEADIGVLTGMTSWLLRFVEMAKLETGKTSLREIWPTLQVIGHGGVPASVYRKLWKKSLVELESLLFAESYAASEGYIALRRSDAGARCGSLVTMVSSMSSSQLKKRTRIPRPVFLLKSRGRTRLYRCAHDNIWSLVACFGRYHQVHARQAKTLEVVGRRLGKH